MPRKKSKKEEEILEPVVEKKSSAEEILIKGKTVGQKPIISVKKVSVNGSILNEVKDIESTTYLLTDEELAVVK